MKRLFLLNCFIAAAIAFVSCDAKEQVIEAQDLPANTQSFVQENFPNCMIYYADMEKELMSVKYDVILDCDVDLEFDKNGEWTEVDCGPNPVPDKIVPAPILSYVKAKYPNYFIDKIDKDRHYDVELNVGLELVFNLKGEFLRIDD